MRTNATATFTAFVETSSPDAGTISLAGLTIHMENAATVRPMDLVVVDADLDDRGIWFGRIVRHLTNPLADRASQQAATSAQAAQHGPTPEVGAAALAERAVQTAARSSSSSVERQASAQSTASPSQSATGSSRAARFGATRPGTASSNARPSSMPAATPARTATEAASRPPFRVADSTDLDDDIPF